MPTSPIARLFAVALALAPAAPALGKKPMDLHFTQRDANGFPKNPTWTVQSSLQPGQFADPVKLCQLDKIHAWSAYAVDDDPKQLKGCTDNKVYLDIVRWVASGPICWGVFPGHADWLTAVTLEGKIFQAGVPMWGGGLDNDFSFDFQPLDHEGKPATNLFTKSNGACNGDDDPNCPKLRARGLHLETWDSESIGIFELPFWKTYLKQVDKNDKKSKLIDGKHAIISGMPGLDCAHECHVEIHPLIALAVQGKVEATSEHWGMFVRNFGNGGYCSSTDFKFKFPRDNKGRRFYKFVLPWKKGAKSFSADIKGILHADSDEAAAVAGATIHGGPNKGIVVKIFLPKASEHGVAEAEVTVHWTMDPKAKPAPPPPPPPPPPTTPPPPLVANRINADKLHEVLLEKLSPAQRAALPSPVEPPRRWLAKPMEIQKLTAPEPPEEIVYDNEAEPTRNVAREQRMKAHLEALQTALGGEVKYRAAVQEAAGKLSLPPVRLQEMMKATDAVREQPPTPIPIRK